MKPTRWSTISSTSAAPVRIRATCNSSGCDFLLTYSPETRSRTSKQEANRALRSLATAIKVVLDRLNEEEGSINALALLHYVDALA